MELSMWLDKGGWITWVLLVVFLVGISITLERSLYFITTGFPVSRLEGILLSVLNDFDRSGRGLGTIALEIEARLNRPDDNAWRQRLLRLQLAGSQIFRIVRTFAAAADDPEESRRLRLEREGADLMAEMKTRLEILNGISIIAPLLGLLGTVTGMMAAFQVIAGSSGSPEMGALAAGIWEAMITTAAGLMVAIPAYMCYGAFAGEINRRIRRMNFAVHNLEEVLHRRRAAAA